MVYSALLNPQKATLSRRFLRIQQSRAFQLRRELYRKPGGKALKHAIKATF